MSVITFYVLLVAVIACVTDLRSARIPNWLTFSAAIVALGFHTFAGEGMGLGTALLGLVVGLAVFFPLFALRAMGAGDVKLLAAFGAWVGPISILWVALYTALAGGAFALMLMASRGYLRQGLGNIRTLLKFWSLFGLRPLPAVSLDSPHTLRLPYALPIAVGLVVMLWRA